MQITGPHLFETNLQLELPSGYIYEIPCTIGFMVEWDVDGEGHILEPAGVVFIRGAYPKDWKQDNLDYLAQRVVSIYRDKMVEKAYDEAF